MANWFNLRLSVGDMLSSSPWPQQYKKNFLLLLFQMFEI